MCICRFASQGTCACIFLVTVLLVTVVKSSEALGIPFVILSASDPKTKCLDFATANFEAQSPLHWYKSMGDQVRGKACLKHPTSAGCTACSSEPTLGVVGAPCHPFSTARTSRFEHGSVKAHHEYEATMTDVTSLLETTEPKIVISEQVEGFDKPYIAGGRESPKQELLLAALTD